MSDDLKEIAQSTAQIPVSSPTPFETLLLSRSERKLDKLLNNTDEALAYALQRNSKYTFRFPEPLFVSSLRFSFAQKAAPLIVEFESIVGSSQTRSETKPSGSDDRISACTVNAIISGFGFKKESGFLDFQSEPLNRIEVLGFKLSDMDPVLTAIGDLGNLKDRFAAEIAKTAADTNSRLEAIAAREQALVVSEKSAQEKLLDSTQKVTKLLQDIQIRQSEYDAGVAKLSEQQQQLASVDAKLAASAQEVNNNQLKVQSLTNRYENYQAEIAEAEAELTRLKSKMGLISNEYGPFFAQSNRFIWLYVGLGLFPFSVIGFVAWKLFSGAALLTFLVERAGTIPISDILLSRIPFVTIAVFLIHASYSVLRLLVLKVMDIQEEKMIMNKIGIIVQDLVQHSAKEINITAEEKLQVNIRLRLQLVQAYLEEALTQRDHRRDRDRGILARLFNRLPNPIEMLPQREKG